MTRSTRPNCAAEYCALALSLAVAGTVLCACKSGKKSGEGQGASSTSSASTSATTDSKTEIASPDSYRLDDGTAAGRALAVLARVEVPALDGDPACADYARNTSTLFIDLGHQLRRLRDRGTRGLSRNELSGLVAWFDARAGMLEQMARAKAMPENELGRAHLEFTGAVADLANAFGEAYGQRMGEPEPEYAVRLGNAAENFAVAIRALGAQCDGSATQSPPPAP